MKNIDFFFWIFSLFLVVKLSMYLNRHVFVMLWCWSEFFLVFFFFVLLTTSTLTTLFQHLFFYLNPVSAMQNCSRWHTIYIYFFFFAIFFQENKTWYFMWIVCCARHIKNNISLPSAAVVISMLRVKFSNIKLTSFSWVDSIIIGWCSIPFNIEWRHSDIVGEEEVFCSNSGRIITHIAVHNRLKIKIPARLLNLTYLCHVDSANSTLWVLYQ